MTDAAHQIAARLSQAAHDLCIQPGDDVPRDHFLLRIDQEVEWDGVPILEDYFLAMAELAILPRIDPVWEMYDDLRAPTLDIAMRVGLKALTIDYALPADQLALIAWLEPMDLWYLWGVRRRDYLARRQRWPSGAEAPAWPGDADTNLFALPPPDDRPWPDNPTFVAYDRFLARCAASRARAAKFKARDDRWHRRRAWERRLGFS